MTDSRISLDDLKPTVAAASERFGVPEEHIWNVIRAENSGSPQGAAGLKNVSSSAVSPKDARGIMQITPIALQDVTQAGLVPAGLDHKKLSIEDQINTGTAYLSRLMKYSTDPRELLAMYNFGPKARFQMDNLPDETSQYLEKVGGSQSASIKTGGGKTGTFGNGMLGSDQLVQMLLQSTNNQNAAMASGAQEFGAANARSVTMATQALGEQQIAVEAAMATAAKKAAVDFTVNKTVEGLQSLFNMDPTQANNEIAASLAQAQEAKDARVSARAEYDAATQINPLENPLDWIMAQVKLPQLAAKNNALADQEDLALDNIDRKTRALNNAKATITANTADQLNQIAVETASNEALKASAVLTGEQAKVVAHEAGTKLQQLQIADKMGDNVRQTVGTAAMLQDRQDSLSLREEQRTQIMEGKKLKEEEEAKLNARLKIVSDNLGQVEPMTMKRLQTLTDKKTQQAWLNVALNAQMGEDLQEATYFYLGGANKNAIVAGGGASVYDTAQKLERSGAGYQGTVERLTSQTPGAKKLTPVEARKAGFKLYQDSLAASMGSATERDDLSSSKWDRQYNPYVAQFVGFSKAIDTLPQYAGLKNNPVKLAVDGLLKASAVKGDNLTSDQQQQVLGSILENVTSHKVEPKKAAADVAAFFKASAEYNQKLNKYDLFSLPAQTSYFYSLNGNLTEFDRTKTDLMDPTTVENAFMRMARQRAVNVQNPFGFR